MYAKAFFAFTIRRYKNNNERLFAEKNVRE